MRCWRWLHSARKSRGCMKQMSVPRRKKPPFLHERVDLTSALPRGHFRKGTASFPAKVHKIKRARAPRAGETSRGQNDQNAVYRVGGCRTPDRAGWHAMGGTRGAGGGGGQW